MWRRAIAPAPISATLMRRSRKRMNWYWTPPLVSAVVQIISASPDGHGGHDTSTPRAARPSRISSSGESTSNAMCSIRACSPAGKRRARASGSRTSISSTLASPQG